MKQLFWGWTVAAKIVDSIGGEEHTYFMGTHKVASGNKYISLERRSYRTVRRRKKGKAMHPA